MHKVPKDIQDLLREVVDHFDKEDVAVRDRQIRTWRQLKLLWEGFQRTWYSEVAHDWRIWDADQALGDNGDQSFYDKPVNVLRAYLESIIAALSVTVPPIKCFPDDASNSLDLSTARAGDKISQLIFRHNNDTLLWLHALFVFCTEGMVACYGYPKSDKAYGTYEEKTYKDETEEHEYSKCPSCGYMFEDNIVTPEFLAAKEKLQQEKDKFQPDNDDVMIQDIAQNENLEMCPNCAAEITPILEQETLVITKLVGVTKQPKSRVCLEAYGGLNVKVANYARRQEETPYLTYSYECHYSIAIEKYTHLHGSKNKLTPDKIKESTGPRDPYEQWGRLPPQYMGEYPMNNVTVRSSWLRPSAFNVLDEEDASKLKKLYPNGAKVVFVNDLFAEACNEDLDDCWTLTYNPLSDYVHFDPLGLLLVSVQDITNNIISLVLQTIEHGIPQTFADPAVLNFDAYRQTETTPGGIYEAKPKTGRSVGDAFHEVKTATLSQEVLPFFQQTQSLGQLASGALPSLFGGAIEGSETASEYSMSRAQALQRQQNTWKIFTTWWKEIFGKAIPLYMKLVKEDERDVQRAKDGGFINVVIRKSELEGKIGKIELEANENLPMTWGQVKDTIEKIFASNNPQLLAVLNSPENLWYLREALGLVDMYIPGQDDVEKQYDEIRLLLDSEPINTGEVNPADGMPLEVPSVEVDPIYDNHQIQFEIVRKWVISDEGRQTRIDNELGYRNVLLHGKQHNDLMQQAMMQAQMQAQAQANPESGADKQEKPNPLDMQEAPIQGEGNVTVQ